MDVKSVLKIPILSKSEKIQFMDPNRKELRGILYYNLMEQIDKHPQMEQYDICFVCNLISKKQNEKFKRSRIK